MATSERFKGVRRVGTWLRRAITENIPLKLLSAVITAVLYLLVQQDTINEFTMSVPVVLHNIPEDKIFVGNLPDELRVRVRGRWSRILSVVEQKPEPLPVDMRGYQDSETYRFSMGEVERHLGQPGLTVVGIDPPSMLVRLDRFLARQVPVVPTLIGEPNEGYEVDHGGVEVKPQNVWVEGPYDQVLAVHDAPTNPIDVTGLSRDLRTEVTLENPRRDFVKYQVKRVTVEIPVKERIFEAVFSGVPMRVQPCPDGYACLVDPPQVEVRVLGKYFTVEKLTTEALTGMVYIGRHEVPGDTGVFEGVAATVQTPPDIIANVKPGTFRVRIEKLRELRTEPPRAPLARPDRVR